MNFNIPLFLDSLLLMLQGMLGIYAVAAVIIFVMFLLNRLTTSRHSDDGNVSDK